MLPNANKCPALCDITNVELENSEAGNERVWKVGKNQVSRLLPEVFSSEEGSCLTMADDEEMKSTTHIYTEYSSCSGHVSM